MPRSRHHRAERGDLENALAEVRRRLLAEDSLGSGRKRNLAQFRLQRLARPHQPMLHHVAGNRRQRQHQWRHAEHRDQDIFQALRQRHQAGPIGMDHPGIGHQIAQRHHNPAADRSGKRRQQQRPGHNHEPGVDLLALGDVAAVVGVIQAFLRGVFCLVGCVVFVGNGFLGFISAVSGRA
jgi:hypothetical protein